MENKNFYKFIEYITPTTQTKYPSILSEMIDKATAIYMPNNDYDLTLQYSEDYVLNFNFERKVIYMNEFCEHPVNYIFSNEKELEDFYKSKLETIKKATDTYKTKKSLLHYFTMDDLERIRKTGLRVMYKAEHKRSDYIYEFFVLSDDYEILIEKDVNARDDAFILYKNEPNKDEVRRVTALFNDASNNNSIFNTNMYILNKEDVFKMIESSFSVKI